MFTPSFQHFSRKPENSIVFTSSETCVEKFVDVRTNEDVVIKYHRVEYPKQHVLDSYERDFSINRHLLRSEISRPFIVQGKELIRLDGGRIAYVMADDNAISLERFKPCYRDDILQFLRIAIEVAKAFSNMHEQNVIHLDIKPQNILITSDEKVKLMDFGVSQVVSMKQPTVPFSGNPVGTYAYMSPEATGRFSRHIDFCADIYSTGMTFYKMLNGEPAFTGQNIELVHAHIAKTPAPLHALHPEIPVQISEIIHKCLEKNPEDRFSSMAALSRALDFCYKAILNDTPLDSFKIGDFVDIGVFSIPDTLYGREKELSQLENLLKDSQNGSSIVLIGGYSGCGKTALVNELNRRLVGQSYISIFASGKYNQFQNQPYEAIIQIMDQLVRQLSLMPKEKQQKVRDDIIRQTDGNAALLMKILPSLEAVIGPQPEVEELSRASEAEQRFAATIVGFLKAFGSSDEYLILFIDDLQWSDTSSLSILEGLAFVTGSKIFVLGAYRDNEVDDAHPLMQTIHSITSDKITINTITLQSLQLNDVNNLIADTLGMNTETTMILSEEVFHKTQGNAFFTREFFMNLYAEKLVRFSLEENQWTWNLDEIKMQNFSANVVDFMVKNIGRFAPEVQKLLSVASCIGSTFKIKDLAMALNMTFEEVTSLAYTPVFEGWLQVKGTSMKWQHDRLQQASSILMSSDEFQRTHLILARRLWERAKTNNTLENDIFDIVNHFTLVEDLSLFNGEEEVKELTLLYLQAGERAIESSAFSPALQYSKRAVELLGENPFEKDYELAFKANLLMARAHYVNSNYEESEVAFKNNLDNAREKLDKLRVLLALNEMYYVTSQFDKSYLLMMEMYKISKLFQDVPREDPGAIMEFIGKCYAEVLTLLSERGDVPISELPLENDEEAYLTAAISCSCTASVFLSSIALPLHFVTLALVNMIGLLKYGKNKFSVTILGLGSWVFMLFFKNVKDGMLFHEQADIMLSEFKTDLFVGRLTLFKAQVAQYYPDIQHSAKNGREFCDRAFVILNAVGDFSFAGFAAQHGTTHHFRFGTNLQKQFERHKRCVAFYRKTKWANVEDLDAGNISALRIIAGLETEYNPKYIQEKFTEARLSRMHHNYCHAFALYFQRKYAEAFEAASKAQSFLEDSFGLNQFNDFFLLMSLILSQLYTISPEDKKDEIMAGLLQCKAKIDEFDEVYVSFFKSYKAIVEAEILRITKPEQMVEIVNAYDEAVRLGDEAGNNWVTGLANELCGEYLAARGFENAKFASVYLQSALGVWQSIGANIKSKQLLDLYPKYVVRQNTNKTTVPNSSNHATGTLDRSHTSERSATSVSNEVHDNALDSATIIRAANALGSEMNLSKLLNQLMSIVMENAGATSGALILKSHDGVFIEACTWDPNTERINIDTAEDMGVSAKIVHSVLTTKTQMTIANAQRDITLSGDRHIRTNGVKSLLCAPIVHKNEILGVLYLENNKIESVFHANRASVINHLLNSVSANVQNARMVKNIMELNASYERFLPRQFLQLLNKGDVRNIETGDNVTHLCSVSFLDIRNFTGITESLSSSGSMKFVNQFLEYICPEIDKNGGFIDKFIGDAVMSLYPNRAENALCGVVGMVHALERLNEDHYQEKEKLKVGIGLHYGTLQLGTVGYANRMDGTAIGDVVNTASRLESLTKGFGVNVIISQEFHDKLVEETGSIESFKTIKFCKLGDFVLKGKTTATSLYEVYDTTWKETGSPREELAQILTLFTSREFEKCEELAKGLIAKYPENHNILEFYAETAAMYKKYEVGEDWDKSICLTKDGTPKQLDLPLKEVPSRGSSMTDAEYEELERYRRLYGKLNSRKAANYCIQWNPEKKKYEKVDNNALLDVQKSE